MGQLPTQRFPTEQHFYPFDKTGIDFFGPFYIVFGNKEVKYYVVIFNCLVTRACHLEICENLTTDNCIDAIRRFTCRRGQPRVIISDNGTNLVSASRELKSIVHDLDDNRIAATLAFDNTIWKFNPPFAPHFGGAWERLIQIAKRTILIILGSRRLTLDCFATIIAETESILNSRPLTNVADQPENEEPLTPNHFLIHRPHPNVQPTEEDNKKTVSIKTWKDVQRTINHFWKRLIREYLPSLIARRKWKKQEPPLRIDDLVWILKDLTPRGIWPLGRIIKLHPGPDAVSRVCTVRTAYGTFDRPVTALARVFSAAP